MPLGLTIVSLLAFALAGSVHIARDYSANAEIYKPRETIAHFDREQWRSKSWATLPRQRIDIAGRSEEPFSVQWAGDPTPLSDALNTDGWTEEGKWSWALGLAYLDPQRGLADLVPRPALHQGRVADLTWTKPVEGVSDQRLVLRAWQIDVMIRKDGNTYPVYLMSLMRERLRRGFNLYAVPSPVPPAPSERDALASLIRSITGVNFLQGQGLDPKSGLIVVDGIP
jgi:hypothetical protein